jgi:hypothetical protein
LLRLAWNHNSSDFCLPRSWDYRLEPSKIENYEKVVNAVCGITLRFT